MNRIDSNELGRRVDNIFNHQQRTFPPPPPYGFSVNSILGASSSLGSSTLPFTSTFPEQSPHPFQGYYYRPDVGGVGARSPPDVTADSSATSKLVNRTVPHRSQTVRPFWIQQQHPQPSDIDDKDNRINNHDANRHRPGCSPPTELVALQPVPVVAADHGDRETAIEDGAYGGGVRGNVSFTTGGAAGLSLVAMAHEAALDDGRYDYKMNNDGGLAEGAEWMMSTTGQLVRYYGQSQLDPLGNYMMDHCKWLVSFDLNQS